MEGGVEGKEEDGREEEKEDEDKAHGERLLPRVIPMSVIHGMVII
jgi:hypothetical protein